MKKLLSILFFITSLSAFSQNTLNQLGSEITTDVLGPGRGAETWNGGWVVPIPSTGSSHDSSWDYYYRFKIEDLQNHTTGVISWTTFDSKVKAAIDANKRFNFGVFVYYPGEGSSTGGGLLAYPIPLHDSMQAETTYKDVVGVSGDPDYGSWMPNWNAPSYQRWYNRLIDSIVNHMKNTTYSGHKMWDVVGYVDIRNYGRTGEWTGYNLGTYPSGTIPSTAVATWQTMNQMIDDFVSRVPDKQLVICTAAVNGTGQGDSTAPATGYKVFTTSNSYGRIGLRRDCIGETDSWVHNFYENNSTVYNGYHFKDTIMNIYKVAPWIGEPCSCCANDGNGLPYGDMPRQITFYHNAGFGNGNFSPSGASADSVRKAAKNAGYRLIITGGSLSSTIPTSGSFNITLDWKNGGGTPSYQKWWKVVYELRASNGSTVLWRDTATFRPYLFLPTTSDSVDVESFNFGGSVSSGTGYKLYVRIADSTGYQKPLPLSITGRLSDGSYLLSDNVAVTSETGVNANAGSDQVITLPTSSVTLDGSGSTGTITSYAWTRVSGPNTPTITSPSSSSTTVTGLIAGTYVFELSVNSGESTDQVTVTVSSASCNCLQTRKGASVKFVE